jgi:hypothetical protein
LETNATTDDGMQYVAKHYGVEAQWKSCLDGSRGKTTLPKIITGYYKIVKTLSNKEYVWISFVEGLHQHAAIAMCLTCLVFDSEDNNIENGLMMRKNFKLAGVPHYKKSEMSPMDVLNAFFGNLFYTPMLMTAFLVQVLVSKHQNFQIDTVMTTLKQSSMCISTNKKLSVEKPISKQLADELTTIMNSPHLIKKTSIDQYLRNTLSIRLTLTKISLIISGERRGNIGCSTLNYYQVMSTPTISRTPSTEIWQ